MCAGGDSVWGGYFFKLAECAGACRGNASMFAMGRDDTGYCYQDQGGCKCYCETATTTENCNVISHRGYNLYRFDP